MFQIDSFSSTAKFKFGIQLHVAVVWNPQPTTTCVSILGHHSTFSKNNNLEAPSTLWHTPSLEAKRKRQHPQHNRVGHKALTAKSNGLKSRVDILYPHTEAKRVLFPSGVAVPPGTVRRQQLNFDENCTWICTDPVSQLQ
jgi:hypothetical protein